MGNRGSSASTGHAGAEAAECETRTDAAVDFLAALPIELSLHILSFLSVSDLGRSIVVNTTWRKLVADHGVWRQAFVRDFGLLALTSKDDDPPDLNSLASLRAHFPMTPRSRARQLQGVNTKNIWKGRYEAQELLRRAWLGLTCSRSCVAIGESISWQTLKFDEHCLVSSGAEVLDIHCSRSGQHLSQIALGARATCLDLSDTHVLAGCTDGRLNMYERLPRSFTGVGSQVDDPAVKLLHASHTSGAMITTVQHDAARVATGSVDSTVRLWDLDKGCVIHALAGPSHFPIYGVNFKPKLDMLVASSYGVRVWSLETQKPIAMLDCEHAFAVDVDLDGTFAVSGVDWVRIYDLRSRAPLVTSLKPPAPGNGPQMENGQHVRIEASKLRIIDSLGGLFVWDRRKPMRGHGTALLPTGRLLGGAHLDGQRVMLGSCHIATGAGVVEQWDFTRQEEVSGLAALGC